MFADEQFKRLLLIGAAIFAMFFMMLSMRRWQQRAQKPRPVPTPAPRPPSLDREMRRDLEDLMVELQELSRKISAEIDTRFMKLETAMRDADRRIATLNRLARGQEAAPFADPPSAPLAGDFNADVAADTRHQVVYELADAGFTPVDIARDLGKTPGEVELILNLRRRPNPA
jgi:hypothetical protein